jgi:DNA-binding GntR family transcriptional regulator
MMDAMSMVIGPAAALACQRLTEDELTQLDETVAASEIAAQDGNFIKVSQLDFEFHRILADATGNRHLSRYLLHLHQVATRFNFAAWKRDLNAASSTEEHRQIVELMHQRDIDGAKSAMRAHIKNARHRIVGTMSVGE